VAFIEGQASPRRSDPNRVTYQTSVGSHKTLAREGWRDYVFAFHDSEEIGPKMLARVAKHTGLKPEDL
jgi:HicA toxin of bacterial toxin-antitoxin,